MEVIIQTAETDEVDPEDVATVLIRAGWYVHSVMVTALPGGRGDNRHWNEG